MTDKTYSVEEVRAGAPAEAPDALIAWVTEQANLTKPDSIYWADGSDEEWTRLTDEMVEGGVFTRLGTLRSV